ncbi:MAG TPA: LON peptidase substrate-binding domain-containing protein [Anaeromyxobacteraceae bacterium]|nr:LON peptidase substrate-binding domain-containing protein [Anaeromyxobacteraceae bacterium]
MAPGRGAKGMGPALAKASAALKIFPLPGLVMLPGAPAPLHVFEPRYRALVEEALATDRIFAIPTLLRDEDAPLARAEVHPACGAVHIEAEERHPDGKLDLLVRGIGRVRIVEELERGRPFREVRAEVVPDRYPAGGPEALHGEGEAVTQLVFELAQHLPPESGAPQLVEAVTSLRDPGALADLVAAATVSELDGRLALIAEPDVARRLVLVKEELASVVLLLSRGRNPTA